MEKRVKDAERELAEVKTQLVEAKEALARATADLARSKAELRTSEEVRQTSDARFAAVLAVFEATKNKASEMARAVADHKSFEKMMQARLDDVQTSADMFAALLAKEQKLRGDTENELRELKRTFDEMRKLYSQVRQANLKVEESAKLKQEHENLKHELTTVKTVSRSNEEMWTAEKNRLADELRDLKWVLANKSCDLAKEKTILEVQREEFKRGNSVALEQSKTDQNVILAQSQQIEKLTRELKEAQNMLAAWAIAYPNSG